MHGNTLNVYANDNAQIGLAGVVQHLYVDASQQSRYNGRHLYARDGYTRAHDWSHMNVAARDTLFAFGTESSSIYFFGPRRALSESASNQAVIVPIYTRKQHRSLLSFNGRTNPDVYS